MHSEPNSTPPLDHAGLDSPVLTRLAHGPTLVAQRETPWGLALGIVGVILLGLFVYSSLSHARQTSTAAASATAAAAPAVTAAAPAIATLAAAPTDAAATPQPASPIAPTAAAPDQGADAATRFRAPAMVVDIANPSEPSGAQTPVAAAGASARAPSVASDAKLSAEERFAEKVAGSGVESVHATRLRDNALIAPQGTVIPAILETAINSDLPGFARAVVSRDVRGFDGSTVLIPRGSKLIGQYKSGVANGQSRAFVIWARVLTPDGVSIDIGSPGADRLGRGGLEGETNTHFFQRFGASIMLSVVSAGLEAAANSTSSNGNTAIVIGSPQQATNVAAIALQKQIDIPDTLTVAQGAPIRVFVARDLDFSGVVQRKP
jgi:type IV secretory pathway VirB10-like protein